MQPAVISIDLGASFTKVGYRTECSPAVGRPYEKRAQLLSIDGVALIPSLAIRTTDRKQPWLFGPDAADVRVGKGMVEYPNWKAGLFHRVNDEAAAKAAIVAQAFFSWLRPQVEGVIGSMDDTIVRVMLPAFADFKKLAGVTRQCIGMAGWRPMELEIATEPHANAIGLLTRGRNVSTKGTKREGPDFSAMFGTNNPYIEKARAAVLRRGGKRSMTIAIIDIGAFTTDLALLKFNLVAPGAEDDGLQTVLQESFEVGTHSYLDLALWKALTERHAGDFAGMSFREREEYKRQLFAGESVAVLIDGKRTQLGDETDSKVIDMIVKDFVSAIWKAVGGLVAGAMPDAVYLTGGGANITRVVEGFAARCRRLQSVAAASPPHATGKTTLSLIDWDGYALERVATALGGASILAPGALGAAPVMASAKQFAVAGTGSGAEKAGRGFQSCTCRGNPDCPKCGGSGYLDR